MILILGVTASGKGRLAYGLAEKLGAEILSVDSMKVYRGMDIGTAKPPPAAREAIRHHLIDVVEPSESFSAGLFAELAEKAVEDIKGRGRPVIAVGGTALYIKALLYGLFEGPPADEGVRRRLEAEIRSLGLDEIYQRLWRADPAAAARIHPNDSRRIVRALEVYEKTGCPISRLQQQFDSEGPPAGWRIIGVRRRKEDSSARINARVRAMVEAGLVDEVRALAAGEKTLGRQAAAAIGYAEVIEYLRGRTDLEEAIEKIKINTRRLAKQQRTWFKRFTGVDWLNVEPDTPDGTVLDMAVGRLGI
jgi:tRNA dimethylallyltransferase